jgi:hypothetical protein
MAASNANWATVMTEADLSQRLIEASSELIAASQSGSVDGDDVARHIGLDVHNPEVFRAFAEIDRRGELTLDAWGGGMGLPHLVSLNETPTDDPAGPPGHHGPLRVLLAPLRWVKSDQNRVADRIAATVLAGVIVAAIVYLVGFHHPGSPSSSQTTARPTTTTSSRASKTASSPPSPDDGRDPKASGCSPPAEDVPGTTVTLRGHGLTFGNLVLRHSAECNTAWGTVRGLGQEEELRLVIVAERPSDHAMTSYARFGGFNPEGVYGNELFQTHGCVLAVAVIEHEGRRLAQARTPCR